MAYWKRQYTERSAGKPLFRPEPKSADLPEASDPGEPDADARAKPETPDGEATRGRTPSQ
jgi:hypothetical protein